ncbi:MAG: tRNA lysidine(34) synthetase TilS [Clostridiaceae bacterium]|nr:tRNA lysidine(34) synthetase TilS [Clostridiaceae bacterium]
MMEKALNDIQKYRLLEEGDRVITGVSGGPDSVCLLHFLCSLRESIKLTVSAVHVNHMLRAEESDEDERYVKELCASLGVELKSVSLDIKKLAAEKKISLEEAGREARYSLFESTLEAMGAQKVAVAHNKNDQAETVLMNIIRGSGLDGLGGMDYKRGRIIRPLLGIERKEIEAYCELYNLNPRIDSSNLKNIYTRNKVRLDAIPYIDNLFDTDIVNSISKMSIILKDENSLIERYIDDLYNKVVACDGNSGELLLDIELFQSYNIAAKRRILRRALKQLKGSTRGIENTHIESVINLTENGKTGSVLHLPSGIRILKSYKTVKVYEFKEDGSDSNFDVELKIPGTTFVEEAGVTIESYLEDRIGETEIKRSKNSNNEQLFDYDKINGVIRIRKRCDGDVFKPLNSNGTKKLKEYFIDKKIPSEIRDKIPLVAVGKEIIWIVGNRMSDRFKVTENTKRVLRLSYRQF